MLLFRPVGLRELELIAESGWSRFPPRLPFQPIFYPVLNFEYAEQIARDWNAKEKASGYIGFVTRFEIDDVYVSQYEVKIVGAESVHQELWVPAEALEEFNRHLCGLIAVVAFYRGEQYVGEIDSVRNIPVSLVTW